MSANRWPAIGLVAVAIASAGCRGTRGPDGDDDGSVRPGDGGGRDGLVGLDGGGRDAGPAVAKRVFVTNGAYLPDFGGVTGADDECQLSAARVGLGGTWVAWVSGDGADAIDWVPDVGPWYDVLGRLILLDCASLGSTPVMPVTLDEHGLDQAGEPAWTGTAPGGRTSELDCVGWTDSSGSSYGTTGRVGDLSMWTSAYDDYCATSAHLYCFEN